MDKNKTEVIVKCTDNCSCLSIDKWDDDPEYFVTLYNSYTDASLSRKLSDIWKIIRGRQIHHTEVILSEEDFNKIRNFHL